MTEIDLVEGELQGILDGDNRWGLCGSIAEHATYITERTGKGLCPWCKSESAKSRTTHQISANGVALTAGCYACMVAADESYQKERDK